MNASSSGSGRSCVRIKVAACGVFRNALEYLNPLTSFPDLQLDYLSPYLHNYPRELRRELGACIQTARDSGQHVICVYGKCFPDIDAFLAEQQASRIAGETCSEMLMGTCRYKAQLHGEPGTYFLERELITHFASYCREPLELDDPDMLQWLFERYTKVLYIQQPGDADLLNSVQDIARFLKLQMQVEQADYSDLDRRLSDEIKRIRTLVCAP